MVLVFTKFHGVMAIPLRQRLAVFPCSAACGCSQKTGYYFEDITLIAPKQYNLVPGSASKIALKCLIILYITFA